MDSLDHGRISLYYVLFLATHTLFCGEQSRRMFSSHSWSFSSWSTRIKCLLLSDILLFIVVFSVRFHVSVVLVRKRTLASVLILSSACSEISELFTRVVSNNFEKMSWGGGCRTAFWFSSFWCELLAAGGG